MENKMFKIFFSAILSFGIIGLGWCLIGVCIFYIAPLKPSTSFIDVITKMAIMYFSITIPIALILTIILFKNIENWITHE